MLIYSFEGSSIELELEVGTLKSGSASELIISTFMLEEDSCFIVILLEEKA